MFYRISAFVSERQFLVLLKCHIIQNKSLQIENINKLELYFLNKTKSFNFLV